MRLAEPLAVPCNLCGELENYEVATVSHTFIRREIAALEKRAFEVERFSIRPAPVKLADPEDIAEEARTTVLLARGIPRLALTAVGSAALHPIRFLRALHMSLRVGLRSEHGLLRNLAYLRTGCTALRLFRRAQCSYRSTSV